MRHEDARAADREDFIDEKPVRRHVRPVAKAKADVEIESVRLELRPAGRRFQHHVDAVRP